MRFAPIDVATSSASWRLSASLTSPLPLPLPMIGRDNVFLFAGRIVADKGADAFVRAYAAIARDRPGWRAVMIGADRFAPGSPDTPFLATLRRRAAAAGIEMRGYQPHAAVLAAMARAAIVVAPSRWQEPFGMVALEALACGAALIASRNGALPEVAGEAATYADPDTPGALETAMRELSGAPARREVLQAAGLMRAKRFDLAAGKAMLTQLRE